MKFKLSKSLFILMLLLSSLALFNYDSAAASIEETKNKLGDASVSDSAGSKLPQGGMVYNCTALNVRMGPSTDYPVIGGLSNGAGVSIIGQKDGWWKIRYNGGEAYVSGKYIDVDNNANKSEQSMSDSGTVQVSTSLNVRSGPWGDVIGKLGDGDRVNITGKVGDWYKISYNGKTAYVHSKYVSRGASVASSNKSDNSDKSGNNNTSGQTGNIQQKIVNRAESYIGSTRFRGPEVNYGNLACAQFVSTVLKDVGVLNSVVLNVRGVISGLKSAGWHEVSAPPFKPGDVITWKTYDSNGDGVKDNDTHVGIIDDDGQAISNSSSLKMPRKNGIYYAPVCRVLRA